MSVRSNIPMTLDEEGNWCVSNRQMRDGSIGSWTPRVPIQRNNPPIDFNTTLIPDSRQSGYEGSSLQTMSTYLINVIKPETAEAAKKPNSEEGLKKNLSAINATSEKVYKSRARSRTRTPLQEVKLDVDQEVKETRTNSGNSIQQGAGCNEGTTSTNESLFERDGKGFAPAATSTPTPEKTTFPKGGDTNDEDGWLDAFELLPILPVPQEAASKALNPLAGEWKPANRQTYVPASPPSMNGLTRDGSESSWESDFESFAIGTTVRKIVNASPEATIQPREPEDSKANEGVVQLQAFEEREAPQAETRIHPRFCLENQRKDFIGFVQTGLMSERDKIAKWNSLADEQLLANNLTRFGNK